MEYRKGDAFRVSFDVELPCDASGQQVEEWINYMLNWRCQIMNANPLSNHDMDASGAPSWSRR